MNTDQRGIKELEQLLAASQAEVTVLRGVVSELLAKVADLEARLNQKSGNSNLPPSGSPPVAPKPTPGMPTGGKPGGQPGHKGHHRAEAVPDHATDHRPTTCAHCESPLTGVERAMGEPVRHQIADIPPVRPIVTEHRLRRMQCGQCGKSTRAARPYGVPTGNFGHRIVALVALLTRKFGIHLFGLLVDACHALRHKRPVPTLYVATP